MVINKELELAKNFIEKTDRNLFLTGKAGTGKTTFLHSVKKNSLKRMVVVAPTGVAAINAKGVTIHSFFQLPFGPIVPNATQKNNSIQRKFSRTKIDIIKSLDLVIIDEISMVRADVLDGIDEVLRRYKDRNKPFGGVQVLMIGDLQQLSPVVRPNEWSLLSAHYQTAYFFSSHAFQKANVLAIELKHIYRQQNQEFISILNEIRHDSLSETSTEILNRQYHPNFLPKPDEGYITLTTHNNRAKAINEQELVKLPSKEVTFSAKVTGNFNEKNYPNEEHFTLKIGAQVMFIKNDSTAEKRYYNGKIGTVITIEKDSVFVECEGNDIIETTYETWDNISYSLNDETQEISEKIEGTYTQIPLRLAWAITIHKSQGLTFEKAIIDAEASFAHGQTYVALSRCKTLEGIVLKTPIKESSIINDSTVNSFNKNMEENVPTQKELANSETEYQLNLLAEIFNFHAFLYPVTRLIDLYYQHKTSLEGNIIEPLQIMKDKGIVPLLKVGSSFKYQLKELSEQGNPENNKLVQERFKKGISYFKEQVAQFLKKPMDEFSYSTDNKAIEKDIKRQVKTLDDKLSEKWFLLQNLTENFSVQTYLQLRAKSVLQEPVKRKKVKVSQSVKHTKLFEDLRMLRDSFAQTENVHHFQVFTQKSLFEMCDFLPLTLKELRKIHGMGKVRVDKYGEEIIEVIQEYCEENGIEKSTEQIEIEIAKKPTKQISFEMFKEGLSIKEIAEKRGFVIGTIEGHLLHYIEDGSIKVTEVISEEKVNTILEIIKNNEFESLTELKETVGNNYSYTELRMVLKSRS